MQNTVRRRICPGEPGVSDEHPVGEGPAGWPLRAPVRRNRSTFRAAIGRGAEVVAAGEAKPFPLLPSLALIADAGDGAHHQADDPVEDEGCCRPKKTAGGRRPVCTMQGDDPPAHPKTARDREYADCNSQRSCDARCPHIDGSCRRHPARQGDGHVRKPAQLIPKGHHHAPCVMGMRRSRRLIAVPHLPAASVPAPAFHIPGSAPV